MRIAAAAGLLLLCLGRQARADDAPWAVKDAPWRAVITAAQPPNQPYAGYAIVLPEFGQTRPDMADVLLTDDKGQPVPLAPIYRQQGDSLLLLAQKLDAGKQYAVYFGAGDPRSAPAWTPKTSLLMETRQAPPGSNYNDWPSLEKAWRNASSDGAGFVPLIYQGENQFGGNIDFLTHYTGWLQTGASTQLCLYTLSSDASFVLVNGQYAFGWPGQHSPRADQNTVPQMVVQCIPPVTKIDYYAAKGDGGPQPGMVLGWNIGGKFDTVPDQAWLHPGGAQVAAIERAGGGPAPVAAVQVRSYAGYAGLWYYETALSLPARNLDGWTVQWHFADGAVVTGTDCTRVLIGDTPQIVTIELQRGAETITGVRRIAFPNDIREASVNDRRDLNLYLGLFDRDNPAQLSPPTLDADFKFLRDFGSDLQIGRVANAWLQQQNAGPGDPLWIGMELAHLRLLSETNPHGALDELHRIDSATWRRYERELDLFELDLLAFQLRDPTLINRASQIGFLNPNSDLAIIAKVRVGDLYRGLGKYKEAIAQYQQIGSANDPSIPAQDRAWSLTVGDLLGGRFRDEAAAKLLDWETHHPMAKFSSDFLLLRARTLMRFGRWSEALAEIASFEAIQPESSFAIDAEFYRARALYELGRKDEARKIWNGIVQNYPKDQLAGESKRWALKP